jgi:predicted phage terminase large subunit-like protein
MTPDQLVHDGLAILHEEAREHFLHFQRLMHPIVSSEAYIHARHTQAIAHALDKVARGETKRLLIAVCPRHFKSYQASVAFPAYLLGRDPGLRIICASYGSDLAESFAMQSREILRSLDYRTLFPETRLASKNPPLQELRTTHNGYRFMTSVGGVLTGKGADVVIIDDPMKAVDLASDVVRDKVGEWFNASLMTRFDKPAEARIIVVMQRLHQDDLIGRLRGEEGWELLELPGIMPTSRTLDLGFGRSATFAAGDILFPERFDAAVMRQLRHDLGEAGFAAQILQQPTPAGGHLFDLGKAERYDEPPGRSQFEATIVSVDCASAAGQANDYTAITSWGVIGRSLYLLDAVRGRWTLPKTLEVIKPILQKADSVKRILLIENGGSGLPLAQMLREDGVRNVWTWAPKDNKETRADFANLMIEQKIIHLPRTAPWLDTFEAELAAFPHGTNDDYVDSFSQIPWNLERNAAFNFRLSQFPKRKYTGGLPAMTGPVA